jgi:hypothetical protein
MNFLMFFRMVAAAFDEHAKLKITDFFCAIQNVQLRCAFFARSGGRPCCGRPQHFSPKLAICFQIAFNCIAFSQGDIPGTGALQYLAV